MFTVVGQSASFVLACRSTPAAAWRALLILAAGPLIGAVLIAVWFPETSGRELEAISVDLGGPAGV